MEEISISKFKDLKNPLKRGQSKKKYLKKEDTQDFLDLVIDPEGKTIQIKSTGEYIGAVMIQPVNIFGLRYEDQKRYLDTLDIIANSKKLNAYQIYCSETGTDTKQYINVLSDKQQDFGTDENGMRKFQILEEEKDTVTRQSYNKNLVSKYFYMIIKNENLDLLKQQLRDALYMFKTSFSADIVSYEDLLKTIYRYFNPFRSTYESLRTKDIESLRIEDLVAPVSCMETKHKLSQYMYIDKAYCKTYVAYAYPQLPSFAWLSYLTSFRGVDFSCHVKDCDNSQLIKSYDKQYDNLQKNFDKEKHESDREKIRQDMDSVTMMIQSLTQGTKKAVSYVVTLRLEADTMEELDALEDALLAETASFDVLLRQGFFDQEALFKSTAPIGMNYISEYEKDIVSNTISFGFPYVFDSLNDPGQSILIGQSKSSGGPIFYNHLVKTKSRTNSNEIAFGLSGSGKTYFLMDLIYHRHARDLKQIIIDLEGKQMNKLTSHLGGEVVNCSTGHGGIINPLQVRITIDDDEDGDKIPLNKIYPLASHIQYLRTFFQLYFTGLDRLMLSTIENAIEILYDNWGITYDTTALDLIDYKAHDYPIMSDLLTVMDRMLKDCDQSNKEKLNRIESVRDFVKRLSVGADSVLFNGYTNVDLTNDTICFVLAGLQMKDATILRTQYYNILTYILTEVISGKFTNWLQIYADEVHLLMSKDLPEVMVFLRQLIKIIRKYNGGLTLSTQDISDVMHPDLALYGEALLSNSNYKFYFKQSSKSVQYMLSNNMIAESDTKFLQYAELGQAYLDCGDNAFQIEIVLSEEVKDLFDSFLKNERRT